MLLEMIEIAWERGRDAFDTAPVSPTQTRVLYAVEREPGINMRSLGRHLAMAAPSVSRLCDRLQAAGFLHRSPRAEDRREIQLRLTEAGAVHLRTLRLRRAEFLRLTMDGMTPADRRALAVGLSAFCAAIGGPPRTVDRPYERRHSA
ncbi:MarR family winged helix-turn-helix transcriptional regulator [Streptomyces griseus]|uniref:MarR family winged helix-turn-helix transcriptional regulator n=1 Tax=Streptomyces griseus TaxID=1911 RepID=UPI0020C7D61C|nr:MarR family transcriptional regulator [Streptomyces griseus]